MNHSGIINIFICINVHTHIYIFILPQYSLRRRPWTLPSFAMINLGSSESRPAAQSSQTPPVLAAGLLVSLVGSLESLF